MSRLQLKLVAAPAGLVIAVTLVSGFAAERGLRTREIEGIAHSLESRAQLVRDTTREIPFRRERSGELDALADRGGRAARARITLIGADGVVVGDSEVPLDALAFVENHGLRPEVAAALSGRVGRATRTSQTVGRPLLYIAIPRPGSDGTGAVRLAVGLARIDASIAELRGRLLAAGGLGLLVVLGLAYPLSKRAMRPIQELQQVAADMADGQLDRRLGWVPGDELGEIAASMNRLGEQLRQRLDRATEEKERLEAVLRSMAEGVLVLEGDRVALANPRLRELLGIWGTIEGRSALEAIRNPDIEDGLAEAASSKERKPTIREFEIETPDLRRVQMHAVAFPASGPVVGTVAVFRDVTELHHVEQMRRDFVANASHELRTPLTSIRGFVETLLDSQLSPDETRAYLLIIARNAARLHGLLDDLLELSRIEGRREPMRCAPVDVAAVAADVLEEFGPRLRDAGIRSRIQVEGAEPAWADRRAVEQVLVNLLDNAVKYTDSGGRIEIAIASDAHAIRLVIQDDGIGIADSDRARIFERFYRVDEARSRALGGTGLGLAIVRHLVHAMDGEIGVESESGRGSRFSVHLPRAHPDPSREP